MQHHIPSALRHAAEVSASSTTYAASAVTMVAGMSVNEWLAIGGFLLAVLTFSVNWHYRRREDKRKQQAHDLHVKKVHDVHERVSRWAEKIE